MFEEIKHLIETLHDIVNRLETAGRKFETNTNRSEATVDQLGTRTIALGKEILPLTKLFSEVELAEVQKRAVGNGVPELFCLWAMTQFKKSDPADLPSKRDAFSNCGPGTIIGKKLASAGWGLGESTFGKHLGVIRKLLIEKGILADESKSKKRSRTRDYDPSSVIQEDINQSDPFEQTADRDDFAQLRNKGEKTKAGDDNIYTDPIPNAPPDTRSQELPEDLQDSTDE